MNQNLFQKLQTYFAYKNFRAGQEQVVDSILDENDTVAVMPTGAGKSLCFQFPALILPGITIVISPLIALMKNQIDSLNARGINAITLNSSQSYEDQQIDFEKLKSGETKIIYIAPERLANAEFINQLKKLPIKFLAIDEAHCISSWGHDFRPDYQKISEFLKQLKTRPIVAAFTATATKEVVQDIKNKLTLQNPKIFISGFNRANLQFFVQEKVSLINRKIEALRLVKAINGGGIIYALTIKEAEEINTFIKKNKISSAVYHAKLDPAKRTKIQDAFMENKYKVIVATVAFGMGIDKSDIRFVIHVGMPPNLERYYQEAGRAGRDGELAYCIILHNGRDKATHHYFIQKSIEQMRAQKRSKPEIDQIVNLKYRQLESIENYVSAQTCRRKIILEYFQDVEATKIDNCKTCDICMNYKWENNNSDSDVDDADYPIKKKRSKKSSSSTDAFFKSSSDELSSTVQETVDLYQQEYTPNQIAKMRSLGLRTIMSHLTAWYATGGNFDYENYVSQIVEDEINIKIDKLGSTKLKPIKSGVSKNISYEQINLVLAKRFREKGAV